MQPLSKINIDWYWFLFRHALRVCKRIYDAENSIDDMQLITGLHTVYNYAARPSKDQLDKA